MKKWFISCIVAFTVFTSVMAEKGEETTGEVVNLQVLVIDGATEEPIPAAKIIIRGQQDEIFTDFDGLVTIERLTSGEFDIEISFVSYEKKIFKAFHLDKANTQLLVKLYP